ncbi:MAG: endonuclease [Paracoccaceae bacterium]|jgi:NADH-quinone oxidoreductase subunit E|nr:endonuclease [Paracoccaceae bacterium]
MSKEQDCSRWCVKIGAIIGVVVALLAYLLAGFGFLMSIILGLIGFGLGYWLLKTFYCSDVSEPAAQQSVAAASPAPAAASKPAAAPAPAAKEMPPAKPAAAAAPSQLAATSGENWTDSVSANSGKAAASRGATGLKPSVVLGDEETLRDGVGGWRYESGATAYKAASTLASAAVAEGDYDGDGVVKGKNEGAKPTTLSEAREGGADDFKQIKGVGPKMEGMLNGMGFYHFDQVAAWSDQEVAWVDANLEGFKGRVSRDNWVEQAKVLAEGGETEFSKCVGDGGVY